MTLIASVTNGARGRETRRIGRNLSMKMIVNTGWIRMPNSTNQTGVTCFKRERSNRQ